MSFGLLRNTFLNYTLHFSLAKREMLLAANESLVGTQQKKLQVTADDFHRTKARNDQLVQVRCTSISYCRMTNQVTNWMDK